MCAHLKFNLGKLFEYFDEWFQYQVVIINVSKKRYVANADVVTHKLLS